MTVTLVVDKNGTATSAVSAVVPTPNNGTLPVQREHAGGPAVGDPDRPRLW